MISIGSRFADYGLTGGFFLFAQLFLFAWSSPESAELQLDNLARLFPANVTSLPEVLQSAMSSLLVALAVVSIFFIGLLLDLMGSVMTMWEASVFKRHLDENKEWFRRFAENNRSYIQNDYDQINDVLRSSKEQFKSQLMILKFWKLDSWRQLKDVYWRGIRSFAVVRRFRRLENLLTAYVITASGDSSIDWLTQQSSLCRTSRAISASLMVLVLEMIWLLPRPPLFTDLPQATDVGLSDVADTTVAGIAHSWFVPLVLFPALMLTVFITYRAYSRFCSTLFSLVYACTPHDDQ